MPANPIAIVAILTIYHNLQYHRLIWFHNQKYGAGTAGVLDKHAGMGIPSASRADLHEKYGAAELISRRLLYYLAFGIFFGVLYQGPRQFLGFLSLKNGGITSTSEQSVRIQLGASFLWGFAFIHYYLDSKIWRVRRDPSVGKALKME
jgi:hypothetical protein